MDRVVAYPRHVLGAEYSFELSVGPKLAPESSLRSVSISVMSAIEIIWKNGDKRSVFSPTPLDEYVWREDLTYSWELLEDVTTEDEFTTQYVINMTSQTWLDSTWMDRSIWWHLVVVVVPKTFQIRVLRIFCREAFFIWNHIS